MPPWGELAEQGSLEGLGDEQRRQMRSRAVDQPFGTYTQPLHLENPAREALPKVGILCSFLLDQVQELIASGNPEFPRAGESELAVCGAAHWSLAHVLQARGSRHGAT
jgi:hypothetical protein